MITFEYQGISLVRPGQVGKTFPATEAKLLASDGARNDFFGTAVSISGNVALVGAYWDDDMENNSGSAYVYTFLEALGNGLAGNFGFSYGLWHYTTSWTQLSTADAEGTENNMLQWENGLAVDFESTGLWSHNGTSWTRLSSLNCENVIDINIF